MLPVRYVRFCWLMAVVLIVVWSGACAISGSQLDLQDDDSTSGGEGGSEAGLTISVGVGGGSAGIGCSADLQSTVDAEGNTVEVCPPDQGCWEGECIPACEAAGNARGSIGCEYWVPDPPFTFNQSAGTTLAGPCHAVFIANTWGRSAVLSLQYNGQIYDAATHARIPSGVAPNTQYNPLPPEGLPPEQVAVVFLSHQPGVANGGSSLECPVTPAFIGDAAVHGTASGPSFEVLSDTPVTVYDILPYGGASSFLPSASLLYPRTAWGDNYYVMAPHTSASGQLWMLLVGREDGTSVDLLPPLALPGGTTVPAAPANAVTTITVNAGEMVQWLGSDPTGTVIQSDKPIGLWTGNDYLRVTSTTSPSGGGQDAAHQQMAPIHALGDVYVLGGIVTRMATLEPESVPYRMMGVVDGTVLNWEPSLPPGAPASLAAGEVAEFETTEMFVVSSQDVDHPFALSQYMPGTFGTTRPGCTDSIAVCGLGDEEWVTQLPPEQFLSQYVFFTDPTYGTTNLVITRVADASGFHEVEIECLGTVTGWQSVGTSAAYEVAHVDLARGGVGTTPACATSRHLASSTGAFGITVWGTDSYASYGYPAGGNVGAINDVKVIPAPE